MARDSCETAGSHFAQIVRLSAGDAGKRVEFANVIDWKTKESNLKAAFPFSASNEFATYNWDIGTIRRPAANPKKFEVASHQWIDVTDMSDEFGATVLTDCKNGSDKPTDNTFRLTLIRTPGTAGGYTDQATQDIGHHEFIYGIAGHSGDWRHGQTDWQGQRLNQPLIAFTTTGHSGNLGKEFSLVRIDNSRIRLLVLKKADQGDEWILRLAELDGRPQTNVHVSFAAPLSAARRRGTAVDAICEMGKCLLRCRQRWLARSDLCQRARLSTGCRPSFRRWLSPARNASTESGQRHVLQRPAIRPDRR